MKDEPTPEIDWERLETSVMLNAEQEALARRRLGVQGHKGWGLLAMVAAAAAAFIVLAPGAVPNASQPTSAVPAVQAEATPVNAAPAGAIVVTDLKPSSVVQSGDQPLRFTLPGVVSWTLAPYSRAVVDTVQMPHRVSLEEGNLRAEVVPRHSSNQLVEAFVVEAGSTRIAVHGTVFTVERAAAEVTVEVTRGTVTVGPASYRGATTGRLLVSPARARFSLAQGRFLSSLEPTAAPAVKQSRPLPTASPDTTQRSPLAVAEPPLDAVDQPKPIAIAPELDTDSDSPNTAVPSPEGPPQLTIGQARALLVACLSAGTTAAKDTLVMGSSHVTAHLDANGNVQSVHFSPPLRPDLMSRCSSPLWGRTIETEGAATISFGVQFRSTAQ